jgi:hypothetical protein
MPIELMNQDIRVTPDVEPLQIDAEALVRDFSKRPARLPLSTVES